MKNLTLIHKERNVGGDVLLRCEHSLQGILADVASSLPNALGTLLMAHYEVRVQRAKGKPMLGGQALTFLSDIFEIDVRLTSDLIVPWALLYQHSLLVDDLVDHPLKMNGRHIILSQLLLDKATSAYRQVFGARGNIWCLFERYRMESFHAMLREIEWSEEPRDLGDDMLLLQQGRKAALAKFCAATLLYRAKGHTLSRQQENAIDVLCVAIQLLDDLNDISEDAPEGRMNYLQLSALRWVKRLALENRSNNITRRLGPNQLYVALVLSGAVSDTWDLAANNIQKGLSSLCVPTNSNTAQYFSRMAKECRRSSLAAGEWLVRSREISGYLKKAVVKGDTAVVRALNMKSVAKSWSEIISIVDGGPKASN